MLCRIRVGLIHRKTLDPHDNRQYNSRCHHSHDEQIIMVGRPFHKSKHVASGDRTAGVQNRNDLADLLHCIHRSSCQQHSGQKTSGRTKPYPIHRDPGNDCHQDSQQEAHKPGKESR